MLPVRSVENVALLKRAPIDDSNADSISQTLSERFETISKKKIKQEDEFETDSVTSVQFALKKGVNSQNRKDDFGIESKSMAGIDHSSSPQQKETTLKKFESMTASEIESELLSTAEADFQSKLNSNDERKNWWKDSVTKYASVFYS